MVNLESRVDLAAEWLLANITHEESYSGWGWVADVPPNPQNTAEAVCALKAINREVAGFPRSRQHVPQPSRIVGAKLRESPMRVSACAGETGRVVPYRG